MNMNRFLKIFFLLALAICSFSARAAEPESDAQAAADQAAVAAEARLEAEAATEAMSRCSSFFSSPRCEVCVV